MGETVTSISSIGLSNKLLSLSLRRPQLVRFSLSPTHPSLASAGSILTEDPNEFHSIKLNRQNQSFYYLTFLLLTLLITSVSVFTYHSGIIQYLSMQRISSCAPRANRQLSEASQRLLPFLCYSSLLASMTLQFWISFSTFGYSTDFHVGCSSHSMRVLFWAYNSCVLLWQLIHISFLNTISVLMISKYTSSAPTLILKLQISTFYLFLDISSWITHIELHTCKPEHILFPQKLKLQLYFYVSWYPVC